MRLSLLIVFFIVMTDVSFAGRDITVRATGDYQTYDLSGRDGRRGDDGDNGRDGVCSSDRDGNRISDSGSDGSDGDSGDRGSNGGDITIIYNDIRELQKISVYSEGGRGGPGGRGGRGGRACGDASHGDDGDDGWRGSDGDSGSLYLVHKQHLPYKEDNSNSYASLAELVKGHEVVSQRWEELRGARNLLASGSVISNWYKELRGYDLGMAKVSLLEPALVKKSLMNEGSFRIMFSEGRVKISLSDFVGIFSTNEQGEATELKVSRLYKSSNFNGLRYKKVIGEKPNRKILFETNEKMIPSPQMNLELRVEARGRWWRYYTLFNGRVDSRFIQKTEKGYLIDLDSMPLSQRIVKGAKLRLTMKHSLTELSLNSKEHRETWKVSVK